jgi:phosphate:Na+ symporter
LEQPASIIESAAWLIGGLGLFLFGIDLLSRTLRQAASGGLRRVFHGITRNPLRGMAAGTAAAALVQSSSAVTVMVVGFISAGLVPFPQTVGMIIGANLGATLTPQIAALNIESLALPLIGVGAAFHFLSRGRSGKQAGLSLVGFGILFLGLLLMKGAVAPQRDAIHGWLAANSGSGPGGRWAAFLVSLAVTTVIQSSGATVVLVQSLGLPDIGPAIPLLMGAHIGTCITAILASARSCRSAKRAALTHLVFNVLASLLVLPLCRFFEWLTPLTASGVAHQIANLHLLMRLSGMLVFLPLSGALAWVAGRLLPGEDEVSVAPQFIRPDDTDDPPVAMEHVRLEVLRMCRLALDTLRNAMKGLMESDERAQDLALRQEEALDDLSRTITQTVLQTAGHPIPPELDSRLPLLLHVMGDIERVGDHAENIVELARSYEAVHTGFSRQAIIDIRALLDDLMYLGRLAERSIEEPATDFSEAVRIAKDNVNTRVDVMLDSHDARIREGKCRLMPGIEFVEVVMNLRRVANHLRNIGISMSLRMPERSHAARRLAE